MSASEQVMHRMFSELVAQYHPFAQYIGYQEAEDGFILYYQGSGEQQYMVVDMEGNILSDTTVGAVRIMEILAVGATILSAFFGSQSDR